MLLDTLHQLVQLESYLSVLKTMPKDWKLIEGLHFFNRVQVSLNILEKVDLTPVVTFFLSSQVLLHEPLLYRTFLCGCTITPTNLVEVGTTHLEYFFGSVGDVVFTVHVNSV